MATTVIVYRIAPSLLPPPLSASRSIMNSVARTSPCIHGCYRRVYLFLLVASTRLSLATADIVICLYVVSVWLFAMSVTAVDVERIVCSDDCPLVIVVYMFLTLYGFSLANLSGHVLLVFLNRWSVEHPI
jgi:hypothetical protein